MKRDFLFRLLLRLSTLSLLCGMLTHSSHAESWNLAWDIGGGGGINGYTGDMNLSPFPRSMGVNLGLLGRFSFNKYYAARLNLVAGNITGNYDPERYYLPITNGKKIEKFNHFLIGFDANLEVHFLPFIVNIMSLRRSNDYFMTPYATFGLGAMAVSGGGASFYIPMGAGMKVALGSRLTVAGELRFLKLFTDTADSYKNLPTNESEMGIHNRDWVSMVSVTCAYRIFFLEKRCPAYR